jgi:tRNA nucleotidyltransferase (CCA-adding enzyme)
LVIRLADIHGHTPETQASRIERRNQAAQCYHEIIKEKSCFTLKKLALSGDDVMKKCGLKSGPMVGEVLRYLLDEVMQENVRNTKRDLTAAAKRYCAEKKETT